MPTHTLMVGFNGVSSLRSRPKFPRTSDKWSALYPTVVACSTVLQKVEARGGGRNQRGLMKTVLQLIKGLGRGGAEQLLVNAVQYLDGARFSYEVAYLLPRKDALVAELERAGLRVHCLEGDRGWRWVPRLRELVRERGIDLIHSHSPVAAIGARIGLGPHPSVRRVYTEHNLWERYHRLTYWGNLLTFPWSHHVFAVSEHVRESIWYPWLLRYRSMPPVETLYHGVDPAAVREWGAADGAREELGIPKDAPLVGTVANFKAHKGYPTLLRAAVRVRREVPDVRFLLVGQGPLEAEIRRQARELALDETVVFAGFREDVPRVAAEFDAFVLASKYEGLSIALIEAFALGKPAVVTDAGGLTEVVEHEKHGLVVPPDDSAALAEGIMRLLGDPSLRRRMGEAARERAADFDIRNAVRRMEEVYEELLS